MKSFIAIIGLILTISFCSQAQVFQYNNYCTGLEMDSCKQIIHHSTCAPLEGVVLFFQREIKIDSMRFYILNTDTLSQYKIIYYTDLNSTEPACVVRDTQNKVVTLIRNNKVREHLLMTFYMFVTHD